MTGTVRTVPRPPKGVVAFALAFVLIAVGYGPGRIAAAAGFHTAPAPSLPAAQPDFLPAPAPLLIKADKIRFVDLSALVTNSPIPLSDGTMSPPDTIYARARAIELDDLAISQDHGNYQVAITNTGRDELTARAGGGPTSIVEMWITITKLKACIHPDLLRSVIVGYAGVFGGALDSVLQLLADTFAPFVNGPLGQVGPCIDAVALLPLVGVFIKYGVPLPNGTLEVGQGEIPAYALRVTNPPSESSLAVPRAFLGITQ